MKMNKRYNVFSVRYLLAIIIILLIGMITIVVVDICKDRTESYSDDSKIETPSGSDNSNEGENDVTVVVTPDAITTTDKILLLIANSDTVIYDRFDYFISNSGIIISESVNMSAIESELDLICEDLLATIVTRFGEVDSITSDMLSYNSIQNLLDDLENLFISNMIF